MLSPQISHGALDTYHWQLNATLDITATIAGKTIKLSNQPLPLLTAIFASSQSFVMKSQDWQLTGTWSQKKNSFSLRLSDDSIRQLLDTLQRDLLAQSNLGVQLTTKSHQGTGNEKQGITPLMQGHLPIKAMLAFPAYSKKTGYLTLDISFSGQPAPILP